MAAGLTYDSHPESTQRSSCGRLAAPRRLAAEGQCRPTRTACNSSRKYVACLSAPGPHWLDDRRQPGRVVKSPSPAEAAGSKAHARCGPAKEYQCACAPASPFPGLPRTPPWRRRFRPRRGGATRGGKIGAERGPTSGLGLHSALCRSRRVPGPRSRHGTAPSHRLLRAPPPRAPRRAAAGQAGLAHPEPSQAGTPHPGPDPGRQPQARPPARRAHSRPPRAARAQAAAATGRHGEAAAGRGGKLRPGRGAG